MSYALQHYKQIKQDCPNKPEEWILKVYSRRGNTYEINNRQAHIKSYELVKLATSNRIAFNYEELEKLPTSLYDLANSHIDDIAAFDDNNFIPYVKDEVKTKTSEKSTKQIKKESSSAAKREIVYSYYYADTECDVTGPVHKAYWISYRKRGCKLIESFEGEDCTDDFLDALPNHSVVYFHNLAYDARMFSHYIITNSIDKGTRTMSQTFNYCGKQIIFKDSLSLINMKLSRFPSAFHLKSGEKEMFPYKYYTFERLKQTNTGKISEAGKDELECNWNQEQFESNIEKLGLYCDEEGNHSDIKTDYFLMCEYVKFHCDQDVNILSQGFDKFRSDVLEQLKIDVDTVMTAQ